MSNKSRWTREEELTLIKDIADGQTLDMIATKHGRSTSAMELRLKKIIYENASSGKSLEYISKLLKLSEDKVRQYFYSYKEFKEKHTGLVDDVIPSNVPSNVPVVNSQTGGFNTSGPNPNIGLNLSTNSKKEKVDKIEGKLKKLELENKILRLIVENKDLTHRLNKLIKEGKVDKSIKGLIKTIRKSGEH